MATNHIEEFTASLKKIDQLIRTPNLIQSTAVEAIKGIDRKELKPVTQNQYDRALQLLTNISDGSIKDSYTIIYNQLCVLAVSALSAQLEKYFINYANSHWKQVNNPNKIKLDLEQIKGYDFQLKAFLGRILMRNDNSIKFQDLQSTIRSFKEYFNKDINITEQLKNEIIFYQQIRHILVHNDGIVNTEFIRKTQSANLKNYTEGAIVQLEASDWGLIQKSFTEFVSIVVTPI